MTLSEVTCDEGAGTLHQYGHINSAQAPNPLSPVLKLPTLWIRRGRAIWWIGKHICQRTLLTVFTGELKILSFMSSHPATGKLMLCDWWAHTVSSVSSCPITWELTILSLTSSNPATGELMPYYWWACTLLPVSSHIVTGELRFIISELMLCHPWAHKWAYHYLL
jgi:hypothetical protein